MLACGINTILFSNAPTTMFSYFSSNEFSAHAFTVELGKVKPFGENHMVNFSGVIGSLTALISGQPLALIKDKKEDFILFEINQVIDRHCHYFTLNFSDDVENFTDFAIGQRALLTVIPVDVNPE